MAVGRHTALRSTCSLFVVVWGVLSSFHQVRALVPRIEVTCKSRVDLEKLDYDAGLLVSRLPDRIPIYANEDDRCDIYISIHSRNLNQSNDQGGRELMLYFDWLDLYSEDLAQCNTTSIRLFDGSPGTPVTGLDRPICGHEEEMPTNVYYVYRNFLLIRVEALQSIQGSGFRIHFTRYRRAFPCNSGEFTCDTFGVQRCVAEHLVCDQWNDCGDWLDENNCTTTTNAPTTVATGGSSKSIISNHDVGIIIGTIIFLLF